MKTTTFKLFLTVFLFASAFTECGALEIQKAIIKDIASDRNESISKYFKQPNFQEQPLSSKLLEGLRNDSKFSETSLLRSKKSNKKNIIIETYATFTTVLDGFTFHIADYYGSWGNSRVITALDGDLRGYQEIYDNGVISTASSDIVWYKDHFEHTYPAGKVYTYENRQVLNIKQK